ncbi:sensor domain-containing diguanylate cyclase [Desulfurispora thermophila]|uniref:sensor domain-containing diguanylate cyclase n=1 Tax=Desulfurispora thermophila TaxID=265470 RepID=UPI00036BDB8E|nr:PAS domain S-box protein [Desulfurispora thermophila]
MGIRNSTCIRRQHTRRHLIRQNTWLCSILHSISDAVLVTNPDQLIMISNPAASQLLGWPPEDIRQKKLTDVVNIICPHTLQPLWHLLKSEQLPVENSELLLIHSSGRQIPVEISLSCISGKGRSRGYVLVIRDISGRLQAAARLQESESRFKAVFYNAPIGMAILNTSGKIIETNYALRSMLGYNYDEIILQSPIQFIHPDDRSELNDLFQRALTGEQTSFQIEKRYLNKMGQPRWGRFSLARHCSPGNQARFIIAMLENIHEARLAREALQQSKEYFEKVVNNARALIVGLSQNGKIVLFNKYCEQITGWSSPEVLGRDWFTLFVPPAYQPAAGNIFNKLLEQADNSEFENPIITRSGEERIISWKNTIIRDQHTAQPVIIAIGNDITERQKTEMLLKTLSNLDGLTGLANRRYFDSRLAGEWEKNARLAVPVSLIMCDIDHFKAYNDTYGHLQGDDCLKKVAGILSQLLYRPGEMAARYGGEEFVVLLPGCDLDTARQIAENIRQAVMSLAIPHAASPVGPCVTVSLGAATLMPRETSPPTELIAAADSALYRAKHNGRNRVEI